MKKKDIKYRQGRSKAQVESNEKVAFASLFLMAVALGMSLILSLIIS